MGIVELAESNKDLSILVSAVVAADLVDALSASTEKGQTVFAPTNDAFNSLPAGTLDDLMKPENKARLRKLLLEHVVPSTALASDLLTTHSLLTEDNTFMFPSTQDGKVMVAPFRPDNVPSTVAVADNKATNGVVHIIDRVLVPTWQPTPTPPPTPPLQNLVQLCESTPNLSTLTAALVAAELTDTLSDASQKFTVFAPTDDAFNALPSGVLDDLMKPENKQQLVDILTFHVLPEEVKSTDLSAFQAVPTVEGKPLHVTVWDGNVKVGPSLLSADLKNVIAADNLATNGVAHIVDGVLLPPLTLMV